MIKILKILNFLKTLQDPKSIKDLNSKEIKNIVEDVNYKFIKSISDKKYQELIEDDDSLFEKLSKVKDKNSMVDCIRFKSLNLEKIKKALDCVNENNVIDKNLAHKLLYRIMEQISIENIKYLMSETNCMEHILNRDSLDNISQPKDSECKYEKITSYMNSYLEGGDILE